jgi:hypothetical protein
VQIQRHFPFDRVHKEFKVCYKKADESRKENLSNPCNVITRELLEVGLMRQAGFMMPPNYYGLDFIIPVCLKEKCEDKKPVYTFIGVQVKRASPSTNIREIISKGLASSHFVRCPIHGQKCASLDCKSRVSDAHYNRVLQNQLMLVTSMAGQLDPPTVSKNPKTSYECNLSEIASDSKKRSRTDDAVDQVESLNISTADSMEIDEPQSLDVKAPESAAADSVAIENKMKEMIKECFPDDNLEDEKLISLGTLSTDGFKSPMVFSTTRIASDKIKVLRLVRSRQFEQGKESLVAIQSKGLGCFSNVLSDKSVREVANRIIMNDFNVFDEVKDEILTKELADGIVFRNNDGQFPEANNLIRHKYNLPPIPDALINFSNKNIES